MRLGQSNQAERCAELPHVFKAEVLVERGVRKDGLNEPIAIERLIEGHVPHCRDKIILEED